MKSIVILISGRGSNMEALVRAAADGVVFDAQRAHVQSFDQAAPQAAAPQPRLPGAYGKP